MVTRGSFEGMGALGEGSRIGGYLLEECIGQGGMARVYRAKHEALQREVAVKVLLDTPGDNSDGQERFLREARIAAAIKHPNVVNIFDVGIDGGRPYLVMELLDGVDLDGYMHGRQRLDEKTTMDIIVPIAGALAAVHDAGIVHRDLKPGNIFLARGRNDEIEPRLLDFGISKYSADELKLTSAHGPVLGTPFYMSPEAAMGDEVTPLSDQYALGVVLYECVTGVNPFAGAKNFADVVQRVTTGDFKPAAAQNPELSRRMAAIIERAMQRVPSRRFSDLRALGRELLLLAGQRTRITWGLTFNSQNAVGALARANAAVYGGASKPRRSWRALALLPAVALGALGAAWQAGELPRRWVDDVWGAFQGPQLEELSAASPLRLALKPAAAAESAAAAPSAPDGSLEPVPTDVEPSLVAASAEGTPRSVADAATTLTAVDASGSVLEPNATALAVSQALRAGPTPPRPRKSGDRKLKPAVKALTLGTNNAPIFD